MRNIILIGLFLVELALSSIVSGASTNELAEVTRIADVGLRQYLIQIPKRELQTCGLPADVLPEQLSLGMPFHLHCILPNALTDATSVTATEQLLTPTTQYYIPVLVDGISRSVLIVDRVQGQWKAVSLGHAVLGTALGRILADWPENQGFHPKVVLVPQAKEVLFTIPEVSDTNLTRLPLDSVPRSSPGGGTSSKERTLTGLREILPRLKQTVEASMAARKSEGQHGVEMSK
jgi:hypothetical protein